MSEYQYYEFQAIDRPLTAEEQDDIRKLSSRVQLSSTQAVFLYNYGDFRGAPEKVLAEYFDVMFYIANWGTWQLIFRFPKAVVDPEQFQPYTLESTVTVSTTAQHVILNIHITQEEGMQGWIEGEGWLSRLLPLRDDLLNGDLRLLYLVWLRTAPYLAEHALENDPLEPPIPPNLGKLSKPLQTFIELVELDSDLVTAAAKASLTSTITSEPPLENYLSELSDEEKQEFLLKLLRQEPRVDLQLIHRLKELAGTLSSGVQASAGQRLLSELEATARDVKQEREQKAQEAAQRKRIKHLETLAPREAEIWKKVVELIETKQSKPYDEATALLKDLRDLAELQGRSPEFARRFERLKLNYQNRPALMTRFRSIKV